MTAMSDRTGVEIGPLLLAGAGAGAVVVTYLPMQPRTQFIEQATKLTFYRHNCPW